MTLQISEAGLWNFEIIIRNVDLRQYSYLLCLRIKGLYDQSIPSKPYHTFSKTRFGPWFYVYVYLNGFICSPAILYTI